MAAPGKIKKLAAQFDQPLADVVVDLLNQHKTIDKVARELNISESNLFRFVQKENIEKATEIRWRKAT